MPPRPPALLLALLASGCAGQAPPRTRPREAPPLEALAPAFVTPARWDYHPPAPEGVLATARLDGAGCVLTAAGGQRWLTTPTAKGGDPCAGTGEAASALAPEDLTSVIRRGDKTWLFVGASGALYEAADPVGPFTRTVAPPEPFAKVAAGGALVLGATEGGRLLRWEAASGWRPAPTPPAARVFDLAIAPDGRALALGLPEQLFTSADGAAWTAASAPNVGAHHLGLDEAASPMAQGIFESITWTAGSTPPAFTRAKKALPAPAAAVDLHVGRGPSAIAVSNGRAVVDGDRYVEVVRPETEGDPWILARGKIEGRLEDLPLPGTGPCGSIRLGARGKVLFLACVSTRDGDIFASIRQSRDLGSTWSDALELSTPDTDQIAVSVSPEGAALFTGVCKPPAEGSSGCRPSAPVLVRPSAASPDGGAPAAPRLEAMIAGTPQLSGLALLPAFSFDGRSAYFLGRRGKDDKLTLFVSHDGGETFSQRSLDTPGPKTVRRPRDYDDDDTTEEPVEDYVEVDDASAIRPGEDGTVGVLVIRYRGATYVTTDEDGRVLHEAIPPADGATIGGFGRRLLAFGFGDPSPLGEPAAALWESVDGGATWEQQAAPPALARELGHGGVPLACSIGGCVLGDTLARVGWGGPTESPLDTHPEGGTPTSTPTLLTAISCQLAPDTKWTRLEHASSSPRAFTFPDVNQIMRGRSAWAVIEQDPESGAVSTVNAILPESGEGEARIVTRALLGRRPSGRSATIVSRQMEGYAAARVPVPTERDGAIKPDAVMRNIEVAWENYMEGTAGRGRIPDAGPLEATDVSPSGAELSLDAAMITLSVKGFFLQPHSARSKSTLVFLVDPAGKVERAELPSFPTRGLEGALDLRRDVVLEGGQPLGVALVRSPSGDVDSILVGRRGPAGAWEITARAVAPSRVGEGAIVTHTDWTYADKSSIGVTTVTADRTRPSAWAMLHGFRADGTFAPPIPLPTLYDLGDRPRPCSAAERAASPRAEAILTSREIMLFPGTRHPVLVSEPPAKSAAGVREPYALLTAGLVAHGTPAAPCVAGWEATGVAKAPISAVISGDLAHAWLFRALTGAEAKADAKGPPRPAGRPAPGAPGLEVRPMTCRFDPGARIPDALWNERGAAKTER